MFLIDHSEIKPLDNVFFEIGHITIMWYAVLILTGASVALYLGIREGRKIGVDKDFLIDLVLFGIPISVVGARMYYVVLEWNSYKDDLIGILKIYEGGLAIHGAIIAAVIWGYFWSKKNNVNFLKAADLGAVGFLVAQAIGRWGNFMNQEAHGGVVPGATLDDQRAFLVSKGIPDFIVNQMYIHDYEYGINYFHPTFLYESIWNLLGLALLMLLRRTKYLYIGDLGLFYLMWYSVGRGIIEGMRTDSLYLGNTGIRMAQLISITLFVSAAVFFILRHYKKWYPKYYYQVIEENN